MNILQVKKYCFPIKDKQQNKFTYSPLGKALEKQRKQVKIKEEKQIDAITSPNERPAALTNKVDHKDNYK